MAVFSLRRETLSQRAYFPRIFSPCGRLTKIEKTCHSDRIFAEKVFRLRRTDWFTSYIWEFFFHSKTLLSSVFQISFLSKKEFPNVTHKLISPSQAKTFSAKIRSLWQVFAKITETGKLVVYLQKKWKDNCLSDSKFCYFSPKKHVSVTDIWGNEIKN